MKLTDLYVFTTIKYFAPTCRYPIDIVDYYTGNNDGSCKPEDVVDLHEQVDFHIPVK